MNYRTPGVYIEEIRTFPPSVVPVPTAIPVFIGYTETARDTETGESFTDKARRVRSLLEYERFFGKAHKAENLRVDITSQNNVLQSMIVKMDDGSEEGQTYYSPTYKMYYALQLFYANGGGDCYVISVGDYISGTVLEADLSRGLAESEKTDEITLILFPDATAIGDSTTYNGLYTQAMNSCAKLQDRFTIMDVWMDPSIRLTDSAQIGTHTSNLRGDSSGLPNLVDTLKYGAVYFPYIETILDPYFGERGSDDEANVSVVQNGETLNLATLRTQNNNYYYRAIAKLSNFPVLMPPSAAMAGIYARTDNNRGVWKAPANVNIDSAIRPIVQITDNDQQSLNVDENGGKSINAIRTFTGIGASMVWGARTLAGNDNEWRYISVRRFFNFVEESVKKATFQFVFEPNDPNTWTRVKSMIENFLNTQWKAGALFGSSPEQAYQVKVGLNETMSQLDILEGRMIIEIAMAVVRPAEFIILRFSHKMFEA